MIYKTNVPGGGIEARFFGLEVEIVQQAFEENAERLRSLGNDSSISEYDKFVAGWTGVKQTYRGPSSSQLVEPLKHFVEDTQKKVDELLDTKPQELRIKAAGQRYRLGYWGEKILDKLQAGSNL